MCGCASAPGDACPPTQAAPGCSDLPWLYRDTNKFSMTCLSGGMHACVGHSHREEFHEAPSAGKELPGQVPLENKPAQLGQWPSICWGHCGTYRLNVWVQVWLGGVQGKEREIPCRQRGTDMVNIQGKKNFQNKSRRKNWGTAPSSFSSVSKAGTWKAVAKQTQGMWVQGTSQPQGFVLLGLKTLRVAVPDSGLIWITVNQTQIRNRY